MTDELDVLTRLTDYHDHIAAPTVPVADDVRRGRRRLARRRRLAAGGVALAVAGVVLTASLVTGSAPDGAPDPAHTPTPTPTETHTAIDPVLRNGQITGAQRFFGVEAGHYTWRSFDPVSETGLFVTNVNLDRSDDFEGLTVVGPTGPLATLTCTRDLQCPPEESWLSYAATLGPAADEVTVGSGDATAQVIGFDGTLRRTIDLTATITGGGEVAGLRWSADGSRLAVVTHQFLARTMQRSPGRGSSTERAATPSLRTRCGSTGSARSSTPVRTSTEKGISGLPAAGAGHPMGSRCCSTCGPPGSGWSTAPKSSYSTFRPRARRPLRRSITPTGTSTGPGMSLGRPMGPASPCGPRSPDP